MSRKRKSARGNPQNARPMGLTFEQSIEKRLLIWLIGLKIAAIIVVFDPQSDQAFDFAKSIVSRAFAWMLLAVIVFSLSRYGWRILPRGRLVLAVALFVLANAISGLFAESPYIALFGE